ASTSTRSTRSLPPSRCARRAVSPAAAGWRSSWSRTDQTSTYTPLTLSAITLGDVLAASERLEGVAHRTPVLTSRSLDAATGAARVLLKAENFQRAGAFKFRGADNAVASLAP